MHELPSPADVIRQFSNPFGEQIETHRQEAKNILTRKSDRPVVIVGPCSIHDIGGALAYAEKLQDLEKEVGDSLFLVMRVFVEKPRTRTGWKGLLYAPDPDEPTDITKGIASSRQLFRIISEMNIPIATEFVNPLTATYLADFVTWGFIGARTSYSQPHRELSSSLPFPIGFKNATDGDPIGAINGMYTARDPHTFLTTAPNGHIASKTSDGNPYSHLVLRGSDKAPNHTTKVNLPCGTPLIIDCAHGNSNKKPEAQKDLFYSLLEKPRPDMIGVMLESYLNEGKQKAFSCPYTSITDPCLDWETTSEMLRAYASLNHIFSNE